MINTNIKIKEVDAGIIKGLWLAPMNEIFDLIFSDTCTEWLVNFGWIRRGLIKEVETLDYAIRTDHQSDNKCFVRALNDQRRGS